MNIPEGQVLYSGHDYLPYEYHTLLNCHGAYVLEINKKIIGFLAYEIIDMGTAYIPLAGRISPSMQGQGLFKHLMNAVTEKVNEEHPSVRAMRMSFYHLNSRRDSIMKTHVHVLSKPIFNIKLASEVNIDDFLPQPNGQNDLHLHLLNEEELQYLSECKQTPMTLTNGGYLLVHWRLH